MMKETTKTNKAAKPQTIAKTHKIVKLTTKKSIFVRSALLQFFGLVIIAAAIIVAIVMFTKNQKADVKTVTIEKIVEVEKPVETIKEVEVEKRPFTYLYMSGDMATFMNAETYDQVEVPVSKLGDLSKYLKDNQNILLKTFCPLALWRCRGNYVLPNLIHLLRNAQA